MNFSTANPGLIKYFLHNPEQEFFIGGIRKSGKTVLLLLLITHLYCGRAGAQSRTDIINDKIHRAASDKERLAMYKKVVRSNELEQADSLTKLLESGIKLFTQHNYEEGKADLQLSLGFVFSGRRLLGLAEEQLEESLAYFERTGNKLKIAELHNLLGVVEGKRLQYDKAVKHFLYALDIFEKEKNTKGIVSCYLKLGAVNELNQNNHYALSYYKKGLVLLKDDTLTPDYINLNNNIGTLYARLEEYDTAYAYFSKALSACNGPRYTQLRILSLGNLATVLKEKGKLHLADLYYQEALLLAEKQNFPEDIIRTRINMATLQSLTDTRKAERKFKEILEMVRKIDDKRFEAEIMNGIVEEYKVQGRFREALLLNDRRQEIDDSLLSIDKAAEIVSLEVGYELSKTNARLTEVKLSEAKILKERNTTRLIAVLLGFSFLTLLFFFRKLMQLNKKLRLRERELQQANLTKDRLFSIIGHDLRNPLTNVLMVLEMIIAKRNSEDEAILRQLREDSITTLQTLDNLLKWGVSQLNGIVVQPTSFIVSEMIAPEFRQLNNIATHKKQAIISAIPEDLHVYFDEEHFKFIFRNLMFNAIKFTPAGGWIRFSVEVNDPDWFVFRVTDSGVGISKERKKTLFQQFGESDYGTDNEKGSGIGLMLCKLFVEENGGAIWVENNQEGKGSVFSFSIKRHRR